MYMYIYRKLNKKFYIKNARTLSFYDLLFLLFFMIS